MPPVGKGNPVTTRLPTIVSHFVGAPNLISSHGGAGGCEELSHWERDREGEGEGLATTLGS